VNYSKNQIETLKHLEKIFVILNKLNIPFFLDCGTLLKFIRNDKNIFPGNDIDLGIFKNFEIDYFQLKKKLELNGYKLAFQDGFSIFYDQVRIYFPDDYKGFSKHIDIYLYEKKKNLILRKIPHKFCKNSLVSKTLFYLINYIYKLENRYLYFVKFFKCLRYFFCKVYSVFGKSIHQKFDSDCFEPQENIKYNFSQNNSCYFNIPINYEKYLIKRYGLNWRIPDKNWEENSKNFSFCKYLNLKEFKFISKPWRKSKINVLER